MHQDNIPTLGGGSGIGQTKQPSAPNNDYLSMIGDNKNRQPRMRMGMGSNQNS